MAIDPCHKAVNSRFTTQIYMISIISLLQRTLERRKSGQKIFMPDFRFP